MLQFEWVHSKCTGSIEFSWHWNQLHGISALTIWRKPRLRMRNILVGLRQAPAVCVIEPAVVIAAQPASLDIAVTEVGAAMPTMPIDEAVFAAEVLVENEILAHEPHR